MRLRALGIRPRSRLVAGTAAATLLLALGTGSADAATSPRQAAQRALERVEQAQRGELRGRDVTLANRDLAVSLDQLDAGDRARAKRLMARPTDPNGDGSIDYGSEVPTQTCSDPATVGVKFCIHYVTHGDNAPSLTDVKNAAGAAGSNGVPDYVDTMLREFEHIAARENGPEGDGGLGWPAPIGDGTLGNDVDHLTANQFDVYIGDIGALGIFGYAQPEEPSGPATVQWPAYMAMDNDYSKAEFGYDDYLVPLEVTAAHEYNHVLQFAIDVDFDSWFGEATATWMEDQVYPADNDWLNYLGRWSAATSTPLTSFSGVHANPASIKPYGTSVFVHWLSDQYGVDAIRDGWEATPSVTPEAYAVAALDRGLADHHGPTTSQAFGAFAAASAEWRVPGSGFHDRDLYKGITYKNGQGATVTGVDVARDPGQLADGGSVARQIDHTGYRLFDVAPNGTDAVKLTVTAPTGVASSIALVGRRGGIDDGTTSVERQELPLGGTGSVVLHGLDGFSRVTAVVANSDTTVDLAAGWQPLPAEPTIGDWTFPADGRTYTARVGAEPAAPTPPVVQPTPAAPVTPAAPPVAPTPAAAKLAPSLTRSALAGLGRDLSRLLHAHGKAKLRQGRTSFRFSAPGAGRLQVRLLVGGRTFAAATTTAQAAGRLRGRLRATSASRATLRSARPRTATLVLRFSPKHGDQQERRLRVTLRP